jgi:hypothetical protein
MMAEQTEAVKQENKKLPQSAPQPPGDIRRTDRRVERKGPFIKYVGPVAHREISPTEWATLAIDLKDKEAKHVWNVANDKMIEADKFSDAQLDYLLIDDTVPNTGVHNFLAFDYNKDGQLDQVEL